MPKINNHDVLYEGVYDIPIVEEFTDGVVHDVYLVDKSDRTKCSCIVNIPCEEPPGFYQVKLYPGVHLNKDILHNKFFSSNLPFTECIPHVDPSLPM